MQTLYYETSSFISHRDNVVDLAAYRQGLAAVSGEDFPPMPAAAPQGAHPAAAQAFRPRRAAGRQRARRRVLAFWMDVCASGAVLLFSITAVVQFLRLV